MNIYDGISWTLLLILSSIQGSGYIRSTADLASSFICSTAGIERRLNLQYCIYSHWLNLQYCVYSRCLSSMALPYKLTCAVLAGPLLTALIQNVTVGLVCLQLSVYKVIGLLCCDLKIIPLRVTGFASLSWQYLLHRGINILPTGVREHLIELGTLVRGNSA